MPSTDDLDDVDLDDDVKKSSSTRHSGVRNGKVGPAVAGPGLAPLYVSDDGLDRYSMKKGTRVTDIVDFKILPKADVMKDLEELKDQCDFWQLKDQMEEYEGDQFLFIRGPENEFEYNYLWCSTLDSYEDHLQEMNERGVHGDKDKDRDAFGDDGGDGDEDGDDEDGKKYRKGRIDKGDDGGEKTVIKRPVEILSDIEIATLQVKSHRPPLGFYISQSRFKFAKPVDFDDVEPGEKSAEYRRQKIPNYSDKLTLEMGFQAAPKKLEMATQTFWLNSVNKATQYAPVNFHEDEKDAILNSPAFLDFLRNSEDLIIRELQTNETLDIFKDEFREFEDEEVSLGNRLENNLEVFHSFSHFKYSKNKNINGVQWFPTPPLAGTKNGSTLGVGSGTLVSFSCSNNVTFDQWVEQSGKVLTSSILIYSLQDVLHPWLVLEVPGNITTFKVHPTHPEYVVAGLTTGQVLFWDLTDAREKVKQYQTQQMVNQHAYNRSGQNKSSQHHHQQQQQQQQQQQTSLTSQPIGSGANGPTQAAAQGDEHPELQDEIQMPPIKYTVLSYIDRSHSRPVSDLLWIPPTQQVNRKGEYYVAEKGISSQFASVASDGRILFWDFKNRNDGSASKQAAAAAAAAMGGPPTSLAAKVAAAAEDPDAKEPKWAPIFSLPLGKPDGSSSSVGAIKLALGDNNVMMCVSEEGEVAEIDWTARATEDRAKPDTVKSVQRAHFQAGATIERSPHFQDIFLTVGDWTFSIWKVGVEGPVFTSACANEYLACGRWSPTRPGIIVIAKADGTIDMSVQRESDTPMCNAPLHTWRATGLVHFC